MPGQPILEDPMSSRKAVPPTADEKHQLAIEELEHGVHHETTQHALKLHAEKVKASPLPARSQQRRFPK